MQSLDETMIDLLERGEHPRASHFGGVAGMLARSGEIAHSDFAPEFLQAIVTEALETKDDIGDMVATVITAISDDIALNEAIDGVAPLVPLNQGSSGLLFDDLLRKALNRALATSFRTAALRGALLFCGQDSRRLSKLSGEIAYFGEDDDPYILAHAVRIGGVLYAATPTQGLFDLFKVATELEGVADQAHFELGMIALAESSAQESAEAAVEKLARAEDHFSVSTSLRSSRHDAQAFGAAVRVLRMFHQGETPEDLSTEAEKVGSAASAYCRYSTHADWAFDRSKSLQLAAFTSVAARIAGLSSSMLDPIWLEGALVIESELMVAYAANRTVLGGSSNRGLDVILRPRIAEEVRGNEHHTRMVGSWLQRFAKDAGPEHAELAALISSHLGERPPSIEAADGRPTFAALTDRLEATQLPGSAEILRAITQSNEVELSHASENLLAAMDTIGRSFNNFPSFSGPMGGRYLMICWKLLLFLEHRLDATAGQDPSGGYLFHEAGRDPPLEKELQADLLQFLKGTKLPSGDEVRGVGGGRADIEIKIDRHRFIIEVKRDFDDASFDTLLVKYGGQTKTYQATNVKLGFLFVLDLPSRPRGVPDIEKCYEIRRGDLFSDEIDRGIILLKMPANRISPSSVQ
ncbi:hypothetical protein [Rhizobium lusitanum]|jgi:hypothetical protein|uniref:hypothetical protein n=1 Tax=Rhizobium lusitanum TaxID=293958 RepID=UPI000DE07B5A|nr:hypothetical protein [Rhizobium lusitanum]NTJ08239.1 hypothetical protein [Rhizobium lusitanum]